ncbi:MAG: pyruvate:ferredoxin (flavodoxin) oxidoreductase [Elusimicrobiales bacterium]|nr:pyruvate:ferredoxin (flavodoxin) oxidoreductase [Elusimicrobiales bacterium]
MSNKMVAMDGNMAAAYVAHKTNEVIAIYPITPSSVMGELADEKSAHKEKNIWGTIPSVIEMESEGGASGAVHGALSAGALTCTFTCSQGLLLMIPNMYKIAGELTSTVFHVSARALATHALSIFGDHSDVMAVRQTGWALLASANAQEAMDFALIAQAATLKTRVPFMHFFDGFRTSHELNMVEPIEDDIMRSMLSDARIADHKARGLNPENPTVRGTAQNPDVFFQSREGANRYYEAVPTMVKEAMGQFEKLTGRKYNLFEYVGAEDADRIIVCMASGCDVVEEAVNALNKAGEKVGLLKVRLYRPYSQVDFIKALPKTVKKIAVLDRCKENGALGEPLYQDVVTACANAYRLCGCLKELPYIIGGRYGLGSKEFTPAMAKAVFDNLNAAKPVESFTVGIKDDVTNKSLSYDENWTTEPKDIYRALFFGLGSDGTVGANKNTMKIISKETGQYAQAYFVYDSKKAGSMTTSHVRFGKNIIRSPYQISKARFIGCHNFSFIEKYELLDKAEDNAIVLLNSPYDAKTVWQHLPVEVQKTIVDKKLQLYVIDGAKIAEETGMGARVNTIMQTAFFKISGILPEAQALEAIKNSIRKTYSKKGEEVVNKNINAVNCAAEATHKVEYGPVNSEKHIGRDVSHYPAFVKNTLCEMMDFRGDQLPVSALPADGTYPTGTTQYEKRNIAIEVPQWDPAVCIQCGKCSFVCPHAAIRMKAYEAEELKDAPEAFKSADGKGALKGLKVTVQCAAEDCTGCGVCVHNCPMKAKGAIKMVKQAEVREAEVKNWDFFLGLNNKGQEKTNRETVQGSQLMKPLFEFSGACAGCGETAYIKLMTQLFGDHVTIANATGCSSIYGGNLPTTPYCKRDDGKGPAWSNSLFEDNAEFGLGMRVAYDKLNEEAREVLTDLKAGELSGNVALADAILNAKQDTAAEVEEQRARVAQLKELLKGKSGAEHMLSLADHLVKKSVWILGGDGWAYDIGYGGLDHVLATNRKVRVMVLDTEVYSNTGGQMSKSTPMGAVAKFAASGKVLPKKDLGMMAMTYGNIYVAQIAMGANQQQAVKAIAEAEAFDGPSLIIAYAHCINHGINMVNGLDEQKKAVNCGRWILYRYNPALKEQGKNPLVIDSKPDGKTTLEEYMAGENRFKQLNKLDPAKAKELLAKADKEYEYKRSLYAALADRK